ncbi:MAG: nucleotide sugar dehydrogenase [Dehalococcoidia bacterium]
MIAPMVAAKHDLGVMAALGYPPEPIDPGNQTFSLVNTPKVTSGYDAGSAWLTQFFYAQIVERAVPASSLEAAEATKILENTFRFINITFAQEFDEYCEKMGLNAREITTLAGTKPFGFMPFFAGPGIGGHCIAEDPYYLYESMRLSGMEPKILEAAIANHERRAAVIVERVVRRLGGRPIHGARILLLGVSYKPNIGDPRQSPAAPILRQLESEGAVVDYHDSHVPRFAGRASVDLAAAAAEDYDLAVLITEHADIDQAALLKDGWRIVDTRNATRSHGAERPQRRFAERIGEVVRLLKPRPVAGVR